MTIYWMITFIVILYICIVKFRPTEIQVYCQAALQDWNIAAYWHAEIWKEKYCIGIGLWTDGEFFLKQILIEKSVAYSKV